jgi:hypothetical protein
MNELAGKTVSAGAFAHPAFLKESHFSSIKSTLTLFCFKLNLLMNLFLEPLFLSCAESDVAFDTESRRKATDALIAGKKDYHVQVFSGVEHGFALKGDITKPYESKLIALLLRA